MAPPVLLSVLQTIDELAEAFKFECRCDGAPKRKYYKSLSSKGCRC